MPRDVRARAFSSQVMRRPRKASVTKKMGTFGQGVKVRRTKEFPLLGTKEAAGEAQGKAPIKTMGAVGPAAKKVSFVRTTPSLRRGVVSARVPTATAVVVAAPGAAKVVLVEASFAPSAKTSACLARMAAVASARETGEGQGKGEEGPLRAETVARAGVVAPEGVQVAAVPVVEVAGVASVRAYIAVGTVREVYVVAASVEQTVVVNVTVLAGVSFALFLVTGLHIRLLGEVALYIEGD